jgi:hypothetical protein
LPDAVIYDWIKLSKCCIFPDLRFDEPRANLTFQLNSQYSANEWYDSVLAVFLWKLSELDHEKNLIESPDSLDIRHSEKNQSHSQGQKIKQPLKHWSLLHVHVIFAKKGHIRWPAQTHRTWKTNRNLSCPIITFRSIERCLISVADAQPVYNCHIIAYVWQSTLIQKKIPSRYCKRIEIVMVSNYENFDRRSLPGQTLLSVRKTFSIKFEWSGRTGMDRKIALP